MSTPANAGNQIPILENWPIAVDATLGTPICSSPRHRPLNRRETERNTFLVFLRHPMSNCNRRDGLPTHEFDVFFADTNDWTAYIILEGAS